MDKQKAEQTAKQIADQINGPLGPVPMERVLAKHVDFFAELKSAGATWPQITTLLTEAGIRRKDGKVLTAAQLRATISRLHTTHKETKRRAPSIDTAETVVLCSEIGGNKDDLETHSLRKKMSRARETRK